VETVGIRELKNRLSAYIRKVESGDVVLVTDRGVVVAELVPPGHTAQAGIHPGLLELARRDGLRLPTSPRDPEAFPVMPRVDLGGRTIQDLVDEERGDR
jgi:prevent-host-death family protein